MQPNVPPFPLADPRDAPGSPGSGDNARALQALYDRTVDSVKGYAKMVEKAEDGFHDTAERFRALHARQAEVLARLLAADGVVPDLDGTLMGTVNHAVVTFRAFFDDIDEDVMDQVRSGESWVLTAFDEAIAEQEGNGAVVELREMRSELTRLLAETRHLG